MASGVRTVLELFAWRTAERSAGGLLIARGAGEPRSVNWRELAGLAYRRADALAKLGVARGDRVAVAAANSLEWIALDFGVQMVGGVLVPLATSLTGSQLAWQLAHCGCRLLVVGGADVAGKLKAVADKLDPQLKIVSLPCLADGEEAVGRRIWERALESVQPNSLASIVYTSGTSGEPRGVMLTQGNLASNAQAIVAGFSGRADDCRLNVLPFSHAYGRMSDLFVSLAGDTRLALGAGRDSLIADAQLVRPTLLVVVPLLLSRLQHAAVARFGGDDAQAICKLLGGNVRGFICGGARLAADVHEYYARQGTPVWEGYGLTEAAPVVTLSAPNSQRGDAVGRVVLGAELQIGEDGQLLVRGPQVMAGYWQDEIATQEAVQDGWLHTGDLARLDDDGFVYLQGRKKEFIALSSGKKVWPAAIEALFTGDELIEQIMVVGEGVAALGALVVRRGAINERTLNSLANRQLMLEHLALRLSVHPAHEQIRHVWLLAEPWTAEREELTPKMTLRRAVILARHAESVRRMFAAD